MNESSKLEKQITVGDALNAAASHPDMPIEQRNKLLDVLKDIGEIALAPVTIPILLATGVEQIHDGHLEVG